MPRERKHLHVRRYVSYIKSKSCSGSESSSSSSCPSSSDDSSSSSSSSRSCSPKRHHSKKHYSPKRYSCGKKSCRDKCICFPPNHTQFNGPPAILREGVNFVRSYQPQRQLGSFPPGTRIPYGF